MSERLREMASLEQRIAAPVVPAAPGFWDRALTYVKDPANKTKLAGAVGVGSGIINIGILEYVNRVHSVGELAPSMAFKFGLSVVYPLYLTQGYDSLVERLDVKTHLGKQATFTAVNWGWGLCIEGPLYTSLGNPNAFKSAIVFSCLSQVTGSVGIAYAHYSDQINEVLSRTSDAVLENKVVRYVREHPATRAAVTGVLEMLRLVYYPLDVMAKAVRDMNHSSK